MTLLISAAMPAHAQVTAQQNTVGTALTSADGEPLSPYFMVSAGASITSLTPLYVYAAQVKIINFSHFVSDLNNAAYDPNIADSDPRGAYTNNLGTASFASFQPSVAGGTNVVQVTFHSGFPHVPLTSASQITILSNVVSTGGVSNYNISNISVAGGVLTFSITERTDHTTGAGIPEQLTIEYGDPAGTGHDFLNSLHLFINPHPDTTNGVPGGAYTVAPGTNITAASFPSGHSVFHLTHGLYWVTGNITFSGVELYLDDGAILKWNTPTPPALNSGDMLTLQNPTGNGIIRGWGIIDGQAQQQQTATETTDSHGYVVPGNCGAGTSPLDLYKLTSSTTQTGLVDGVVLRNSCTWTLPVWSALGASGYPVTINNIKILGYSGAGTPNTSNADGIDVVSSQFLNITNSFIRTSDDLITLKQMAWTYKPGAVPETNINVVNNTFWNEAAHAIVIGGELYNAPNVNQPSNPLAVDDVVFDSNTVIHDTGRAPLLGMINAYGGQVQNVLFSNTNVDQAVGLIGIVMNPSNPFERVTQYSMAPSTGSGATLQSVVSFTTAGQGAPVLLPGNIVNLGSFTSAQAVAEGFNGKYLTVLASPAPTATSFSATMYISTAVPSTVTESEAGGYVGLEGIPGTLGGFSFCNIHQTTPQVVNTVVGGGTTLAPYIGPIPNIQILISMLNGDSYVGGQAEPAGVTPAGTVYPQSIVQMPQFSNVTVADSSGTPHEVLTYTPGNDFYYEAADGTSSGTPSSNSTPMPQNVIEQTVRVEAPYNPMPTFHFNYYTSTNPSLANGAQNYIPNDMLNPNIHTTHLPCLPSSLLQTP